MANPTEPPAEVSAPDTVRTGHRSDPPESERPESERLATAFAEILGEVLQRDDVPPTSHFFDDLGADSLLMARFCARVRRQAGMPSLSMKDIYRYPTVAALAASVPAAPRTGTAPPPVSVPALAVPTGTVPVDLSPASLSPTDLSPTGAVPLGDGSPVETSGPDGPMVGPGDSGTGQYVLCGILQVLCLFGYAYAAAVVLGSAVPWVGSADGLLQAYLRGVALGAVLLAVGCALPLVLKWVLVGRWVAEEFPVWSPAYLRLWLVRTALRYNPVTLSFVGTPVYSLYLRALGARIGRHVVVLTTHVPVCTDLLTIGDGTVIRRDAFLLCYRAHAGRIQTGTVTLGRNAFVGEKSVLDIGTVMGDHAQLGHTSSLHRGMTIPRGQSWHGSPAEPADVDHVRVAAQRCGTLRRLGFSLSQVAVLILVIGPLGVGVLDLALTWNAPAPALLRADGLATEALVLSLGVVLGGLVVGLPVVAVVTRLLSRLLVPGRAYPLYGVHHAVHRLIARLANVPFFVYLFGESSAVVPYLRLLGYDLSAVVQTGANFGLEVRHEAPALVTVGSGTMVADGLSLINADYSNTSFQVCHARIGAESFLGNNIAFPAGGRTGVNCLLATKVMVPLDGPVHEGVGLLGSPPFRIPRSVERDTRFDHLRSGEARRRAVAAKNSYDLRSAALFLVVRWLHLLLVTLVTLSAVRLYDLAGHTVSAALLASDVALTAAYYVLVERCFTLRPLRPRCCSMYDPHFWWHERLWKVVPDAYLAPFDGTPFKALIWRLLGARVGSRVFDDGAFLTERTLVTLGDRATLNQGSRIQCHSQEDGTFKSDHTLIGADCTLGVAAHVHYGVVMGDGSTLAPDSFLMKGEEIPRHALWGGNPARENLDDHQPAV